MLLISINLWLWVESNQMSELGCDESSTMESKDVELASETTYLRECTVNPLPIEVCALHNLVLSD